MTAEYCHDHVGDKLATAAGVKRQKHGLYCLGPLLAALVVTTSRPTTKAARTNFTVPTKDMAAKAVGYKCQHRKSAEQH